jgi:hypothetical protein
MNFLRILDWAHKTEDNRGLCARFPRLRLIPQWTAGYFYLKLGSL